MGQSTEHIAMRRMLFVSAVDYPFGIAWKGPPFLSETLILLRKETQVMKLSKCRQSVDNVNRISNKKVNDIWDSITWNRLPLWQNIYEQQINLLVFFLSPTTYWNQMAQFSRSLWSQINEHWTRLINWLIYFITAIGKSAKLRTLFNDRVIIINSYETLLHVVIWDGLNATCEMCIKSRAKRKAMAWQVWMWSVSLFPAASTKLNEQSTIHLIYLSVKHANNELNSFPNSPTIQTFHRACQKIFAINFYRSIYNTIENLEFTYCNCEFSVVYFVLCGEHSHSVGDSDVEHTRRGHFNMRISTYRMLEIFLMFLFSHRNSKMFKHGGYFHCVLGVDDWNL